MHVRWRREAALGRSRRRPRVAVWPAEAAERRLDAGFGIWEDGAAAERYAAALIFGTPLARSPVLGRPALVMLSGLPGAGKSYLARELAAQAPVTVVSADRVRRILVPCPTYSEEEHEFVHNACYRLVRRGLAARHTVVLDGTNLRHRYRQPYRDLARTQHAPCHLILLDCQERIIRARLQRRATGESQDASDAGEQVYDLLRRTAEPVGEPHLPLRGDGDVHAAAQAVLALLRPEAPAVPLHRPSVWPAAIAGD
jgi:predicted kinase